MICTNCGKEIPSGNSFCPNCGARAVDVSFFEEDAPAVNPTRISASNSEPSVPVADDELRLAYIGGAHPEQILKKLDSNGALNGYAILFGPFYFLWRKMYIEFFLATLALGVIGAILGLFIPGIGTFISVLIYLIGFLFYPLYRRKVNDGIRNVREKNPNASRQALIEALKIKGGTSINAILLYVAFAWLGAATLLPNVFMITAQDLVTSSKGTAVAILFKLAGVLMLGSSISIIVKFVREKMKAKAMNITGPSIAKPIIAALVLLTSLIWLFGTITVTSVDGYNVAFNGLSMKNAVVTDAAGNPAGALSHGGMKEENPFAGKEEVPAEAPKEESPAIVITQTPDSFAQPESTSEPAIEQQEAPEISETTPSMQEGTYTVKIGDHNLYLPNIPGMDAEQHDGWITYTTSASNFGNENLYVAYMDSYLKTSDTAGLAEDLKAYDNADLYENVNIFDFTASGHPCHAVSYNFKGVNGTNMKIYEDLGLGNYVVIDITDRTGKYSVEELASRFTINV